jgi:hypothetical protein
VDSISKLSSKKAGNSIKTLAMRIESFVKAVEEQKQKNDNEVLEKDRLISEMEFLRLSSYDYAK